MERLTANLTGNFERKSFHGRSYLVAPFVSLRPRVLNGSKGALMYPREEIEKNPGIWNSVPITLGHPSHPITNTPQSARDPETLERVQLGHIFNDHAENGDRKGEAWFDEEMTKKKSPAIYRALLKNEKLQISTGLFTDDIPASNGRTADGQNFDFIATTYRPDHLAVFEPGTSKGACSVDHGCGIGVNSNPEGHNQYTGATGKAGTYVSPESQKQQAEGSGFYAGEGGKLTLHPDHIEKAKETVASLRSAVEDAEKKASDPQTKPYAKKIAQQNARQGRKDLEHLQGQIDKHLSNNQETTAMSLNRSFWNWLGGALGITGNANRHLETGQFLPDGSRISDKQLDAAVRKGWDHVTGQEVPPHDDPDDDGDGGDKPAGRFDRDDGTADDEANESQLPGAGVTNSNPEGHNQYTGGGSRPGGRPGKGYAGKPTTIVPAKTLKAGDVVHHPDTGKERTVTSDAQPTAKGYIRAETSEKGNPVNVHGSTEVHVANESAQSSNVRIDGQLVRGKHATVQPFAKAAEDETENLDVTGTGAAGSPISVGLGPQPSSGGTGSGGGTVGTAYMQTGGSPAGNSNPEGHNQYTGGGASFAKMGKATHVSSSGQIHTLESDNPEQTVKRIEQKASESGFDSGQPGPSSPGSSTHVIRLVHKESGQQHVVSVRKFGATSNSATCPKCGDDMVTKNSKTVCNCGYRMNLSANAFGMSHGAVHGHLQQALAAKTPQDRPTPQIHEVQDDHAIYHDGDGFQKQSYEPKSDGSGVNLTGKPVPVQQQTSFVPATNEEVDMTLTAKQRKEAEGYLCANCDCYKGQEKVVGNREVMSDELITKLVENTKKRKADEVIANAAKKGFQVAGMTLAFNAAGQIVRNDKAEGSNADATGAVGSSTEANESDEEDNGETSEEVTPALKSTKVSDVGGTVAKKTALNRAGLAQLSPELAENMDFLMEGLNAEKRKLATMLVANFADDDPDKAVVFNDYMTKRLKDLRRLAKGLPRYQQPLVNQHLIGRAVEPVYGAAPRLHQPTAPTDNRGDDGDDDLLVCPTINWGRREEKDEFEESAA